MDNSNVNNRYREEEKENVANEEVNSEETVLKEEENCSCTESCECEKNKKSDKKEKKDKIAKLEEENKKLKEQYYRTLADSENFKKRIDDERIRERKYASQRLIEKLLNDLDIFDKAVNMKTDDPNLNNFLIGFQMINNNINQVLEEEGVKKIKLSSSVDQICTEAFFSDFEEIHIPVISALKRIEENAFKWTVITDIFLPSELEYIGKNAFPETLEKADFACVDDWKILVIGWNPIKTENLIDDETAAKYLLYHNLNELKREPE